MKLVIRISILTVILVMGISYFQTVTHLSQTGKVIAELKQERENLEQSNELLARNLAQTLDLSAVETYAKNTGMVIENRVVYIETPSALAVSKR